MIHLTEVLFGTPGTNLLGTGYLLCPPKFNDAIALSTFELSSLSVHSSKWICKRLKGYCQANIGYRKWAKKGCRERLPMKVEGTVSFNEVSEIVVCMLL